jgi:hypothetical protein
MCMHYIWNISTTRHRSNEDAKFKREGEIIHKFRVNRGSPLPCQQEELMRICS